MKTMLRKTLVCAAIVLCCVSGAFAAEPTKLYELQGDFRADTAGLKLVKMLADTLTPESMTVILNAEPAADGSIGDIYIEARGVSAGTPYRLDYAALSGRMIRLTPPSQWDVAEIRTLQPEKWEGFYNVELALLENDLRVGVERYLKEDKKASDKWKNLFVDFRPGVIFASGRYDINSGMNAAFKITSGLEIRGGKQIWLVNTKIDINKSEQTDAIRKEIQKINPPVDMTDFKIPLVLRNLSITDKELRISTATPPKPFSGITYKYVK